MVISSAKHKTPTRVYSPFTFVLRENVFVKAWLFYKVQFVFYFLECFMFIRATQVFQFSRLDDLQNTGFDRLKIVELFGPVFLTLRKARWKETFHTITDFTLSYVF